MANRKLTVTLYVVAGVLGAVGTILYLASYFWGLLLLLAAAVSMVLGRGVQVGRDTVRTEIRAGAGKLLIPFIGIFAAIIIGGIVMLVTGYDPFEAYGALFYGGFVRNWHVSILNAVPLMFTGLSVAFAFNAGLFNIGAEGQYYVGTMAATFLGIYLGIPPIFAIPLIILASASVAATYVYIPALLKVRTGAHEVITTMMFAHIARYLSSIFVRAMGGDPETSKHAYVTDPILEANWLPRFQSFLPDANYRLHIGVLLAFVMAGLVYFILFHTRFGFEIRAVGKNPDAARAQGISVGKNIFRALLFAGFLSGMAGANQVLGLDHKMFENLSAGYGWNGISVALLASNHPIGVIFTSLLWGGLDAGGQYMSRTVQTPNSIVEIIKGIILFLIVAKYIYAFARNRMRRKGGAR